jgi:hypothetical protein
LIKLTRPQKTPKARTNITDLRGELDVHGVERKIDNGSVTAYIKNRVVVLL